MSENQNRSGITAATVNGALSIQNMLPIASARPSNICCQTR